MNSWLCETNTSGKFAWSIRDADGRGSHDPVLRAGTMVNDFTLCLHMRTKMPCAGSACRLNVGRTS